MAKKPSLREVADAAARDRIRGELLLQRWDMTRTARALGISRQGLYDACERLGINVRREQARAERGS
jgi:DNA-binding NtrC family response regulator